jgi:hypothetical protein
MSTQHDRTTRSSTGTSTEVPKLTDEVGVAEAERLTAQGAH